jgi:hypothetical protein
VARRGAWLDRGWQSLPDRARGVLPILVLICLALLLSASQWGGPIAWTPDGLFYQAQKLQVEGKSEAASLQEVFTSPRAANLQAGEDDPEYLDFQKQFFRRRWLLPVLAAGLDPPLGLHALETLSLVGFVLLGPLLYALLRKRFSVGVSLLVAAGCILAPPLHEASFHPLTDSWGLLLEVAAFLAAVLVLERGLRWLPLWLLAMVALSLTRDATLVLVIATGWLGLFGRSRRAAALAASGAVVSAPAPLLMGAPLRDSLAAVFSDELIPHDTSWAFISREYPAGIAEFVEAEIDHFLQRPTTVLSGILILAAVVALARISPKGDPFFRLQRGALVGGLLLLALNPAFSGLRVELALIPPIATGLALLGADLTDRFHRRRFAMHGG